MALLGFLYGLESTAQHLWRDYLIIYGCAPGAGHSPVDGLDPGGVLSRPWHLALAGGDAYVNGQDVIVQGGAGALWKQHVAALRATMEVCVVGREGQVQDCGAKSEVGGSGAAASWQEQAIDAWLL